MISLANSSSPQLQLIHEFDRGFLEKDISLLEKPLHDDFRHIVYPRSLGVPAENKEEWLKKIKGVLDTPIKFHDGTYHSVVEAPGKVVLHATHKTEGLPGLDPQGRESIWIVELVEEGGTLKIKQIEQFTDSTTYQSLSGAAEAAKE